jgi:serine/threonine protein kinase
VGVVLPQPIQFGKYTLFERIGRGGMADVFKARVQGPAGFERIFVVKRILPHLSDDPTFNKMFVEEAKLSARLNHPNIVQVFELGSVEGEYFISMEHVRGRDLAETMRTLWARIGPPRPELVAYIGREMGRALDYAHHLRSDDGNSLGMIHRDVSPSNVMLSYEGAVKLLDFGIAKALGGEGKEEGNTQRGTLKGKFAYMAPEQTQSGDVDHRIDIFAAGIVLHEILTGRRLFKGENDLQTVEKVRQCDVPPPSLQNPLCPPELDAIVLQALSRNRDSRFQSAGELADALDDLVHASRFQPTHLAGLMRDLFPGEAPSDGRPTSTGSVRVSQSMPASSSRPYSLHARSPTLPPVSVSVSASGTGSLAEQAAAANATAPRPFIRKTGFILTVAGVMAAAAFIGGVFWRERTAPERVVMRTDVPQVKDGPVKIRVDSIPDGADVVEKTSAKALGKTPCIVEIQWRSSNPAVLVLRKPGYQDVEKEVRPPVPIFASLRPAVGGGTRPPPRKPETVVAPVPAPEHAKPRDTPTLANPVRGPSGAPPPPAAGKTPISPPPPEAEPSSSGRSRRSGSRGGSGTSSSRKKPEKPGQPGSELINPF